MTANMVRSAIHICAILAFYLATAMLIPGLVDLYYENADWRVFAVSSAGIGCLSALIAIATRSPEPPVVSTRFTFLLVNLLWLTFCLCATVPLYLSELELSFVDAFFEGVSGAKATGSTVLTGLDVMPPGILLWRSMLQWFGGLGVIVLAIFILPILRVGGSNFFKIESSDRYERPFARFSTYGYTIFGVYTALTVLCAIAYTWAGMSAFDGINHAMTTLSTGGLSTHDRSFGFFNQNIHMVAIIFMIIGALPFPVIILFALKGRFEAFRDNQVFVFLGYTLFLAVLVAIYLRLTGVFVGSDAFINSLFNITSIITTTGYSNSDYMEWGPFALGAFLLATVLGGCAGSTSGGIKAYRWTILFGSIKRALEIFIYPNAVRQVRTGSVPINEQLQYVTLMYFSTFLLLWFIGTLVIAATGEDLVTAFSSALTALANVGPALGDKVGPADNFAGLNTAAKYVMAFGMLLGRLELFSMLVLFSPSFWRE
ncbi:MAG: TrkH family potassium uptake protein [Pseudomonadota bacterium]